MSDLEAFLEGQPGSAGLSFRLGGGFTRMLCGIRTADWSQLQVTHSNFDYSRHCSDGIEAGRAHMVTPPLPEGMRGEVVVYPDCATGDYICDFAGRRAFESQQTVSLPLDGAAPAQLSFERTDGALPSRLVTALRVHGEAGTIPAECSLGVAHAERPPKHSHWMPVSQVLETRIRWVDYAVIYGGCPPDSNWSCELYVEGRKEPYRASFAFREIADRDAVSLEDLFGEVDLGGSFGYLSLRTEYGGFLLFTSMTKGGSFTIEHSF